MSSARSHFGERRPPAGPVRGRRRPSECQSGRIRPRCPAPGASGCASAWRNEPRVRRTGAARAALRPRLCSDDAQGELPGASRPLLASSARRRWDSAVTKSPRSRCHRAQVVEAGRHVRARRVQRLADGERAPVERSRPRPSRGAPARPGRGCWSEPATSTLSEPPPRRSRARAGGTTRRPRGLLLARDHAQAVQHVGVLDPIGSHAAGEGQRATVQPFRLTRTRRAGEAIAPQGRTACPRGRGCPGIRASWMAPRGRTPRRPRRARPRPYAICAEVEVHQGQLVAAGRRSS